jgi:hypothetical protein
MLGNRPCMRSGGIKQSNYQRLEGSLRDRSAYAGPSWMPIDEPGDTERMPWLSEPVARSRFQGWRFAHRKMTAWLKRNGNHRVDPEDASSSVMDMEDYPELAHQFIIFHFLWPRHDDGHGSLRTVWNCHWFLKNGRPASVEDKDLPEREYSLALFNDAAADAW